MSIDKKDAQVERVYEEFEPPSDWDHEEGSDTLILKLPGFKKELLRVQISSNRVLRLSGGRQISENKWRRYRKDVLVPSDSDTNGMTAKFEAGKLYVRLPKVINKVQAPIPDAPTPQKTAQEDEEEPRIDWDHQEGSDTLILMLPGYKKEQLRVSISSNRVLSLSGERQISENKWCRFRKEVPVPSDFDTNGITAKFVAGRLYVRLLKVINKVQPPIQNAPTLPTQEAPKPQPPPTTTTTKKPTQEAPKPQQPKPATATEKPTQEAPKPQQPTTTATTTKKPTQEAPKPQEPKPATTTEKPTQEAPNPQLPKSTTVEEPIVYIKYF